MMRWPYLLLHWKKLQVDGYEFLTFINEKIVCTAFLLRIYDREWAAEEYKAKYRIDIPG